MESGTVNLLQMLEDRVRELCYQEKWDEAVHAAETAVRKAREAGEADPSIVGELALSLEVKGDLLRQIGQLDQSLMDYAEALDLGGKDVTDPFGGDLETYRLTRTALEDLIGQHIEALVAGSAK